MTHGKDKDQVPPLLPDFNWFRPDPEVDIKAVLEQWAQLEALLEETRQRRRGIRPEPLYYIVSVNSGPSWVKQLYENFRKDWESIEAKSVLPRWDEQEVESIFGKVRSDIKYVIWEESGGSVSSDGHEQWETRYDDQGRVSYHGHVLDGSGDECASEVDLRKRELRRADPGGV